MLVFNTKHGINNYEGVVIQWHAHKANKASKARNKKF